MTFLGLRERRSAGRGPSAGLATFKRADRRGGTFFFSVLAGMGRLQVPHPRWRMLMCLLHAGLFHH